MKPRPITVLAVFAFGVMLAGCAGSRIGAEWNEGKAFDFRHPHCPDFPPDAKPSEVSVRYLGSGGVAISWQNETLLAGPYFSHAGSVFGAQFLRVRGDTARIEAGLQHILRQNVAAILLGHSHFDHAADVPEVVKRLPVNVPVYANASGVAALAAEGLNTRRLTVGNSIDVAKNIRVTTYAWDHAPQLCHYRFWPCTYATGEFRGTAAAFASTKMRALRGGATYAFLIELLDPQTRRVAFRIYYNDAAGDARIAAPPQLAAGERVDLAILCMASFQNVRGYPESVLAALHPRHVLVSHYDDFFRKQKEAWSFAPLLTNHKADRFMRRLAASVSGDHLKPFNTVCGVSTDQWSMPVPDWPLNFTPEIPR
ncbi:MAG TPA: MBL fold metallo-hydrolase [Thermoanaerobaculia bacterium]|nr:MBL fold metallo-hydrolase [Thermoanaerobaculia bacterium]